jgi:hypothetical protein
MILFKKDKTMLYVVAIAMLFSCIYFYLFSFIRFNLADTPNFINAAKMLYGAENLVDSQSRITKPFVLLVPGFVDYAFGYSITTVILIQNFIFFCLSGLFFAKLLKLFGFDFNKQLLGVFLLYTVQPIAVHSFELINDIAGIFFSIFILYLYFSNKTKNELGFRSLLFLTLALSAGILSKESSGLAAIVIIIDSCLDFKKQRFIKNALAIAFSAIIVFLVQMLISSKLGVQNVVSNVVEKYTDNETASVKIQQILHSFDGYWFYILLGAFLCYRSRKSVYIAKLLFHSCWVVIPFLFIWPSVQDRIIAVAAPIFLIALLYGLKHIQNKILNTYLLTFAGILNIVVSFLIYRFQIQNLLALYYATFFVLFVILLILELRLNKGLFNPKKG